MINYKIKFKICKKKLKELMISKEDFKKNLMI